MKFGLPAFTIEKFTAVFRSFPEIEEVIIYGSRAKGNCSKGSDIDITLVGEKLTEDLRSQVWLQLEYLNTPYLVDLSIFHKLTSPGLIEHIKRFGQSFYKK